MKRKNMKVTLGLFLGAMVTLNGCSLLPQEGEQKKAPIIATEAPYEFEMDVVKRETIYDTVVLYPKYIEAGGEKLSFSESGTIGKVFFEVGDTVKAGDVIAELNYVEEYRKQYEQLEKTIENDQKAYDEKCIQKDFDLREITARRRYGQLTKAQYNEEVKKLDERYASTLQGYEDALYINKMKLEKLKDYIEKGSIISGIDGTINSFSNLTEGGWVSASRVVAQIVDSSSCTFEVSTDYADHFTIGQEVTLSTSSNDLTFETKVEKIDGKIVHFKPVSSDLVIAINTQARLNLELDRRENVLTLTATCVRYADDVPYVYYIDENGIRSMKTISVGMKGAADGNSAKTRIEITDGLSVGDLVVKK